MCLIISNYETFAAVLKHTQQEVQKKSLVTQDGLAVDLFKSVLELWSCVTSYYSPLRGSPYHTLDTVNPAMGMILCSSMHAFEKYSPGGYSHVKAYGDVPPKWVIFQQKSLDMGPILL